MLPPDDELTRLGGDGDSETRLASETPPASRSGSLAKSHTSSSGWLSASGAIDHGRFPPGTVLGDRYRIVGRLGRGGMGEVFRADDLKLGQPVALKFLPPDVDRDPARLTQLHTEVRMARQVSHPNVCRVYDIDEIDGHTFLSMEYVDGEDLARCCAAWAGSSKIARSRSRGRCAPGSPPRTNAASSIAISSRPT